MGATMCQCDGRKATDELHLNQWSLYGRLTQPLEDGCIYEGDWKNGKPEGKGKVEWLDGWVFEGRFIDGKPHGGDLRSPKMLVDQS